MTRDIRERTHTIKEAAALTGLPASTLRYYESVGVIPSIARGESSRHRVYTDADMDVLIGVACLAATGMPVADMRRYVENRRRGPDAADQQIALLEERAERLAEEERLLRIRRTYVNLKIDYWRAVAAGDEAETERLGAEARSLVEQLKPSA